MSQTVTSLEKSDAQQNAQPVRLGLIGLGTVGQGVCKVVAKNPDLVLQKIAVKDINKKRDVNIAPTLLTTDPMSVVNDPAVQVVIEVVGGVEGARQWITEALNNKKHVITANKELIAKHGAELFKLANQNNVRLLFEGAVAGGIPIIMPLKLSLAGNTIEEVAGILNGTTNFILTKMTAEKAAYADVLKDAQAKGFAEADPTNDVEGYDTRYKTAILASIAFGKNVNPNAVHCEGITQISPLDITNAAELGYVIKLLGIARRLESNEADTRVHPVLVPASHPLANIHNEFNAVWVKGDAVGEVMFYGRGAGELPTASAVMGDVLAICSELSKGNDPIPLMDFYNSDDANIADIGKTQNKYYIRLNTNDVPGVIGQLGTACGKHDVSLESVLQKGVAENSTASIVLITHTVSEAKLQAALDEIKKQPATQDVACVIRVWQ